jgi:hypothetical protein
MPKIAQRFRIKSPIIALVEVNGLHTSMFAAVGDIVTITCGPLDGVRMVEVKWRDKAALMFTMEIREHAELIEGAASYPTLRVRATRDIPRTGRVRASSIALAAPTFRFR